MRFLIQGPQGEQYELTDASNGQDPVRRFLDEYAPQGFTVLDPQPVGYDTPAVETPNPQAMSRAELDDYAAKAGIADPESFPSKRALLTVLLQAQQGTAETVPETVPETPEPEQEPPPTTGEGEDNQP